MRVLLCLLSREHVPNLLSVHHYKPDQLVLIMSEPMKRQNIDQYFLEALEYGGLDYSGRHHAESLDAEDDLAAVRRALQNAHDRFPDAEWIANLTGGAKPMSIAAYEFFEGRGKRIYINGARPGRFLDLDGRAAEVERAHQLSIKEFLAGYGFELVKSDGSVAAAEERAREWERSANLIARRASETEILEFRGDDADEQRESAREKGGVGLSADLFSFPCEELRAEWLGNAKTRDLSKYEARFLTGEWLEVFFWNLLTNHAEALGIRDVRLGLMVKSRNDNVQNELDVAFIHEHRLSVIECKSGSQSHDPKADILYKVEAVIGQFGADLVRSYLATTSSNVLDEEGGVRKALVNRSALYNCRILPRDQIRELARRPDDAEKLRELLWPPRDAGVSA